MINKKRALFSTAFLFLLPLSAAQSGNQFFQLFSGYVGVPITNGQQFILRVLAPFIFVFAITRFVAEGAFKSALEDSSFGGQVEKRGPDLVGIATAGSILIMFGEALPFVIIIFAIIGIGWFLLRSGGYAANSSGATGAVKKGLNMVSGSSSSSSGGSGLSREDVQDMIGSQVEKIIEKQKSVDAEEEDEKQKEDQTEAEEEEGADPDQVEDEIGSEKAELMDIVQKIEDVESDIKEVEDKVDELEEEELSELQSEARDLDDVKQFEDRFLDEIDAVYSDAQNGGLTPEEFEEVSGHIDEQLQYLNRFREDLEVEHNVHQATEELINELQALRDKVVEHGVEEIQNAESLTEELEDEEQKAEALAQKYGSREIFEEIEADESDTADIERELKNTAVERMQALKQRLQDQIDHLKEIRQYDEQDWAKIADIVQELDRVEQDSGRFASFLNRNQSDEFMQKITEMNSEIEEIEEMTQQLSSEHQA